MQRKLGQDADSTPYMGFEPLPILIWGFVGGFLSRYFQFFPGE